MESDDQQKAVTIKIKVLGSEVLHELTVPLSIKILALKEQISEFTKFPIESIRLIFRGRSLQNNDELSAYKVEDGHTIIVHCAKSARKNDSAEDPPPPPRNLNSASQEPPNDNQEEHGTFPQSPPQPPLPHNYVTDFKRKLSSIQRNISTVLEEASRIQMNLTGTNVEEINNSIQNYSSNSNRILQDTFLEIQSIQNAHFVTNNNRVEANETNNVPNVSNNNRPPNDNNGPTNESQPNAPENSNSATESNQNTNNANTPQPRPVVEDIFTPSDRAFIQQQISTLDDYVSHNQLDELFASTDIYREFDDSLK